mmetsp:Transcript_18590/g.36435  ORF Transcript_18590/g.36435 Transcript_18590/m.36435 type:complete len:83 (-) Transcript_18590:811-1059(-)
MMVRLSLTNIDLLHTLLVSGLYESQGRGLHKSQSHFVEKFPLDGYVQNHNYSHSFSGLFRSLGRLCRALSYAVFLFKRNIML